MCFQRFTDSIRYSILLSKSWT